MKKVNITNINGVFSDIDYETTINNLFNTYIESIYVELTNALLDLYSTINTLKDNASKIKDINKQIEMFKFINISLKEDNDKSKKDKLDLYLNIDSDNTKLFKTFREIESKKKIIEDKLHHSNEIIDLTNNEINELKKYKTKLIAECNNLGNLFLEYMKDILILLEKINTNNLNFDNCDLKINDLDYINKSNLSSVNKSKINRFININYSLRLKCFNYINEIVNKIFECYKNNNYIEIEKILNCNKFRLVIDLLVNNDLEKFKSFEEILFSSNYDLEFNLNKEILNYLKGNIYDEDYLDRLSPIIKDNKDENIYKRLRLFINSANDDKKEMIKHESNPKR